MSPVSLIVNQKRLILTTTLLLAAFGLYSWFGMNRQEDPFFPYRHGYVLTQYPGADVRKIERLVIEPLEQELAQIEEIEQVRTIVRSGFARIVIAMHEHVYDTDTVWDRIRRSVSQAALKFPEGVLTPVVEDKLIDTAVAVYAVTGDVNALNLRHAARDIKNRLFALDDVGKVKIYGMPDEQIRIRMDDAQLKTLGISEEFVVAQLRDKTHVVPIASAHSGSRRIVIDANTEFNDIDEIRALSITLPGGQSVPLSSLADVSYQAEEPAVSAFWSNSERAIALAVYVPVNRMHVVKFGEKLKAHMDTLRGEFPQVRIEEVFFQPQRVADRISELGLSLLTGMGLVTLILTLFLGLRSGLVVALIIPLVTFSALTLFNLGGGVLHQMAISGMVIALGMLVDNAIVMVENIKYHMDHGLRGSEASVKSVRELSLSLGSATGTTLAAFVPMLLSTGNAADFTKAIPVVIMLSITVSYIYAIFVTPAFSHLFLRPSGAEQTPWLMRLGQKLGEFATRRSWLILILAALFIVGSMFLFRLCKKTSSRHRPQPADHQPDLS